VVKGGARHFEDQAQCPFRAFARHRLKVQALEESSPGLDPRFRGNALHLALQFFWERVKAHEDLVAFTEDELREVIADCVTHALQEVDSKATLVSGSYRLTQLELEKNRLIELIAYWLKEKEFYVHPLKCWRPSARSISLSRQ